MVSGILGLVASVLAVVCGWLASRWWAARRDLAGTGSQVRDFGERTARAESELAALQDEAARLDANLSALAAERAELIAERDELRQAQERTTAAQGRLEQDLARARAEQAVTSDALARERERAADAERATADAAVRTTEYQALLASVDAARSESGGPVGPVGAGGSGGPGVPGATWPILLATLARRWAAAVGALPQDRGVRTGAVSEQLAEALGRESERLREEVGVDVEVQVGGPVEPADPVTFLLAVTDLLGVLAAVCERVVVDLGAEGVRLTGDGWSGPTDELELARARAAASGVTGETPVVDGERVTVTLRPRATATT